MAHKKPTPAHVKEAADAAMRRSGLRIPGETEPRRRLGDGKPSKAKATNTKTKAETPAKKGEKPATVKFKAKPVVPEAGYSPASEAAWRAKQMKRWNEKLPEQVQRWCAAGITDAEIASMLGVDLDVFYEMLSNQPKLQRAYHTGQRLPDTMVERALFAKAVGHTRRVRAGFDKDGQPVYVDHWVAPSVAAMEVWLYNRMPEVWKKRLELDPNAQPSRVVMLDPTKLAEMKPAQLAQLARLLQSPEGQRLVEFGGPADSGQVVDMDTSEYAKMVGEAP